MGWEQIEEAKPKPIVDFSLVTALATRLQLPGESVARPVEVFDLHGPGWDGMGWDGLPHWELDDIRANRL